MTSAGRPPDPHRAGPGDEPAGTRPGAPVVVAAALTGPASLGTVRLVCVDGPAGSGKTTTADDVSRLLRVRGVTVAIVHLDDLYDGWTGLDATLWPRLAEQVLEPLRAGRPGCYRRYDWAAGAFADRVDVPVPDVLVVEGCGSAQRAADDVATLRVWVEAPDDLRLARGLARDGEAERDHWTRWMADERVHFARERTRERADVVLDARGRLTDTRPRGRAGLA